MSMNLGENDTKGTCTSSQMLVGTLVKAQNWLDSVFNNQERNGLVITEGNNLTFFTEARRFIYIQVKLSGDDHNIHTQLYKLSLIHI